MVCKKGGSWPSCGDYRCLNLATTHDSYPCPASLDLSNKLHRCKYFSCTDLVKGYHQIPMAQQYSDYNPRLSCSNTSSYYAILCNAAQTFQRFMDRLFKHLLFVFT
jgi:putative transposase